MIGEKVIYLILLIAIGMLIRHFGLLSDKGEKDLGKLLVDLFWPALIFSSITGTLNKTDIQGNALLPLMALLTCFTGLIIGVLFVLANRFSNEKKSIFLYHSLINNFVFMVLPFAITLLPAKGAGLLFLHNLGMILMIWLLGVPMLAGKYNFRKSMKQLLTPGLIITVLSILLVLTGLNVYIPTVVTDTIETTSGATIIVSLLVVGSQVYKMGGKALKFNAWNIQLALVRLVIVPLLLFGVALLLRRYTSVSRETLIIFTLVNSMPVSLNSVSLAVRFDSSPALATEGVVFTHLFSMVTILINVLLIRLFL